MYRCNYCNEVFENLRIVKETHYECEELPYETFYECPMCGSDEVENYEEEM